MFIDRVPNRNSPPAILLRESRREGGKVRKHTIANLSGCPEEAVTGRRSRRALSSATARMLSSGKSGWRC